MKEQEAKELEQLVAKAMQKATLETPSFHFTDKVMTAVNAEQQTGTIRYAPLIPNYMWVAIAALIFGFTAYLWFLVQPAPIAWPAFSFDFIENNPLSYVLFTFKVSKITGYAVLLLAVMVCVQIPMLKHYFNKRQVV